jgi:hypothetical protein
VRTARVFGFTVPVALSLSRCVLSHQHQRDLCSCKLARDGCSDLRPYFVLGQPWLPAPACRRITIASFPVPDFGSAMSDTTMVRERCLTHSGPAILLTQIGRPMPALSSGLTIGFWSRRAMALWGGKRKTPPDGITRRGLLWGAEAGIGTAGILTPCAATDYDRAATRRPHDP